MTSRRHRNALQAKARLHWYEIDSILGQGGFGITYLGRDLNLGQQVAIKEFLPSELAVRESDSSVHPVSAGHSDTYGWGLNRFLAEAQTLARFRHPNIVRVLSVFEANNTAYMVMEYEQGQSLEEALKFRRIKGEGALLAVLLPLLDGLELIHEAGFIHRDIKPDNVYLREDGVPVLLDFGSARQALGVETRTLTTLVSPGYAPFEQYNSTRENDRQGPWTDIYSLGAMLYRGVTGSGPMDAVARADAILTNQKDLLIPAGQLAKEEFSPQFLDAIEAALRFHPGDRPQSIPQWRAMFAGLAPDTLGRVAAGVGAPAPEGSWSGAARSSGTGSPRPRGDSRTGATGTGTRERARRSQPPARTGPAPARGNGKGPWPAVAVLSLVVILAGCLLLFGPWDLLSRGSGPPPVTAGEAPPTPVSPATPTTAGPSPAARAPSPPAVATPVPEQPRSQARPLAVEPSAPPVVVERPDTVEALVPPAVSVPAAPQPERPPVAIVDAPPAQPPPVAEAEPPAPSITAAEASRLAALERERERQGRVQRLLAQADEDLANLRLTSPAGQNAYERYGKVLALVPDNPRARQGLARIADRYVELSDSAIADRRFERADTYLAKAESVLPGAESVVIARERLAGAREERRRAELAAVRRQAEESEARRRQAAEAEVARRRAVEAEIRRRLVAEDEARRRAAEEVARAPVPSPVARIAVFPFTTSDSCWLSRESDIMAAAQQVVRADPNLVFDNASFNDRGLQSRLRKQAWAGNVVRRVPDDEAVYRLGRELNVESVLMAWIDCSDNPKILDDSYPYDVYLFDIATRYRHHVRGSLQDISEGTREVFREYQSARASGQGMTR